MSQTSARRLLRWSDSQSTRALSKSLKIQGFFFFLPDRVVCAPKVFLFGRLESFTDFHGKNPPNCFRSPHPLVSAGICLQVFNAAEWQIRIRDHEMACSLQYAGSLGQTLLQCACPSSSSPDIKIHNLKKKRPESARLFQKNYCLLEMGEKNLNLWCGLVLDLWSHLGI